MRTSNATDLGINLDRFPSPSRASDLEWIFIDGPPGWAMEDEWAARQKLAPCKGCGGGELRRKFYCSRCDRCGLDGQATLPGLDVDYAPDPEWRSEGTIYDPDPELAGGVQKPARLRRGVARSRRAG